MSTIRKYADGWLIAGLTGLIDIGPFYTPEGAESTRRTGENIINRRKHDQTNNKLRRAEKT